jgi:hypothetical protein
MQIVIIKMRTGSATSDDISKLAAYDRINLLIDLYFRRLLPTFKEFTLAVEPFLVEDEKFTRDGKGFAEDRLNIGKIGEKLKQEVVALPRQGSLRAWIEDVQDYDQHRS